MGRWGRKNQLSCHGAVPFRMSGDQHTTFDVWFGTTSHTRNSSQPDRYSPKFLPERCSFLFSLFSITSIFPVFAALGYRTDTTTILQTTTLHIKKDNKSHACIITRLGEVGDKVDLDKNATHQPQTSSFPTVTQAKGALGAVTLISYLWSLGALQRCGVVMYTRRGRIVAQTSNKPNQSRHGNTPEKRQ